jgi:hypothetical protein
MTTLRNIASKKGLVISAILGAGILLSSIVIVSPAMYTLAQQQLGENKSSSKSIHEPVKHDS